MGTISYFLGWTPLHEACNRGNDAVAKLLIMVIFTHLGKPRKKWFFRAIQVLPRFRYVILSKIYFLKRATKKSSIYKSSFFLFLNVPFSFIFILFYMNKYFRVEQALMCLACSKKHLYTTLQEMAIIRWGFQLFILNLRDLKPKPKCLAFINSLSINQGSYNDDLKP